MVGPGLHHTERFCVFAAALEPAKLIDNFHGFKPVLDAKLLLQKIAMLALMLLESEHLLLKLLADIHIMVGGATLVVPMVSK